MSRVLLRIVVVGVLLGSIAGACGSSGGEAGSSGASEGGLDATSSGAGTTGERITVGGAEALTWGDGPHGVVLAHGAAFDAASWEPQAVRMAEQGTTVVAAADTSPDGIRAAIDYLQEQRNVTDVALVGGSAGADSILALAANRPDLANQLILLSPNRTVDGLGPEPKLFIASEGESVADVSQELASSSPGDENEVKILPGTAHAQNIFATDQGEAVTQLILARLARFATA